jgi:hypothetical protein
LWWLYNSRKTNGSNVNNVGCETSRSFRNKEKKISSGRKY